MTPEEIRLELVKTYLPICSKFEALEPCKLIDKLKQLENYVAPKEEIAKEAPKVEAKTRRKKKSLFDNSSG